MRGGLLLATWTLGQWLGCAVHPPPAPPSALVTSLNVDFPVRDRGSLTFEVRLPAGVPQVRSITWELFVDGVRLATGTERTPAAENGLVSLKTPLITRHVSWREGDATLDVGLRGEVDVGLPEPVGFKDRREVAVHGRPMLNIPSD